MEGARSCGWHPAATSRPPEDAYQWSLTNTPNAVEGSVIGGYLSFATDGPQPVAYLYEVTQTQADPASPTTDSLTIGWGGSWDTDGDVTTLELTCDSLDAVDRSAPIDCATTSLSLTCQVIASGTENATLDCGEYRFRM